MLQVANGDMHSAPKCESLARFYAQCIKAGLFNFNEAVKNVFAAGKLSYYTQLELNFQKRYDILLQELKQVNGDVIALQEVKFKFLKQLMQQPWIQDNYILSEIAVGEDTLANYGPISHKENIFIPFIMTRLDPSLIKSCTIIPLPSKKRRSKLSFTVALELFNGSKDEDSLTIYASHLESNDEFIEGRRVQLERIIEYHKQSHKNEKNKCFVIMGDLNMHNDKDEQVLVSLGHELEDLWWHGRESISRDYSYTFDGKSNSVIKQIYMCCETRQMRLDRILASKDLLKQWSASGKMQVFGNTGSEHGSDHFGLTVRLAKNGTSTSKL